MKWVLATISVAIIVLVVVPILAFKLVFSSYTINETNLSYRELQDALSDVVKVYDLKIDDLNDNGPYKVYFDKGMDHICVVRVDNAEGVMRHIKEKYKKSYNASSSGMNLYTIPWYYDCSGDKEYEKIFIDEFNYFVFDNEKKVLWYVQFST